MSLESKQSSSPYFPQDEALPSREQARAPEKGRRHDGRSSQGKQPAAPSTSLTTTVDGPSEVQIVHGMSRSANFFGLIQELIARDITAVDSSSLSPADRQEEALTVILHMLIATCLLNQTRGRQAVPLFWRLICRWPTAEALRDADLQELTDFLQPIGLHRVRAQRLKDLGRRFSEDPPRAGVLYERRGTKFLPRKGLASNVVEEAATCIGHLPGVGRYAIDSFRIFLAGGGAQRLLSSRPNAVQMPAALDCGRRWRTENHSPTLVHLPPTPPATPRKKAERVQRPITVAFDTGSALLGYGGCDVMGQTAEVDEWKRVLPLDKELRAYLQWRWAKEGILWDPEKGPIGALPKGEDA